MSKTSSEVKRRYNQKTYKEFRAQIHIPLMDQIEQELRKRDWSKAEFIRQAAQELLGITLED